MKKCAALLAMLMVVISVSGCVNGKMASGKNEAKSKGLYISFTVTPNPDEIEKLLTSDVYCYDTATKVTEKIANVPRTSQYALTNYDRKNNTIYYTSRQGESHNDELYSYDVATKESKKLTEGIYAVNYMFATDNEVILGASLNGGLGAVVPVIYHTDSGELEKLDWDSDYHCQSMNFNPYTKTISMAAYNLAEHIALLQTQSPTNKLEPSEGENKVFTIDKNKTKTELFSFERNINSVFSNDDMLLWGPGNATGTISSENNSFFNKYSFESKESVPYKVLKHGNNIIKLDVNKIIYVTPDEKEMYFLASGKGSSGLCHYDAEKDVITEIYSAKDKEAINNAFALVS